MAPISARITQLTVRSFEAMRPPPGSEAPCYPMLDRAGRLTAQSTTRRSPHEEGSRTRRRSADLREAPQESGTGRSLGDHGVRRRHRLRVVVSPRLAGLG